MTGRFLRRVLVVFSIALAALVSVGGGGTYVMMEVTTKPQFCRSCHIMEPYVDSWADSSHKNVTCVDCHYEPGLLETFEGKFKAPIDSTFPLREARAAQERMESGQAFGKILLEA